MRRKTKMQIEGPDIKDSEFWDGIGFELIEITTDGKILVRDTITESDMTFTTSWTPLRIAKAVSNARAQYLK